MWMGDRTVINWQEVLDNKLDLPTGTSLRGELDQDLSTLMHCVEGGGRY